MIQSWMVDQKSTKDPHEMIQKLTYLLYELDIIEWETFAEFASFTSIDKIDDYVMRVCAARILRDIKEADV